MNPASATPSATKSLAPDLREPRGRLVNLVNPDHPATHSLKTFGYAIVDICTPERAAELCNESWLDLEGLGTAISRELPSTWMNDRWPQQTHGLLQNQQFGLRLGTCLARLETRSFWEALFNGKRCISSFDATSVARPDSQERTYKSELKSMEKNGESVLLASWLHTDQAKFRTECLRHIQMAFALVDLGEGEQRTQVVIPKEGETLQSLRDRFLEEFPPVAVEKGRFDPERSEWVKHTVEERKWLIENARVITPTLKAGQAILWDSGAAHASIPGALPDGKKTRNMRMSVFVSALPIELVDKADIEVRQQMLENGDTSGHRVTTNGKTAKKPFIQCKFPKIGQTFGAELPDFCNNRVVSGFKRAYENGEEDSVAYKIAEFCGGYGYKRPREDSVVVFGKRAKK